ncbi:MAG: hypothetical protein KBG15_06100 [Kofleriaceae bacterium]|nr:hypothetical protein [Kofleriaceae bacterium]
MKIDRPTVINVTCTLGSATAAVPVGCKAATIVIGVTTLAKTLTIPSASGTVVLPLP